MSVGRRSFGRALLLLAISLIAIAGLAIVLAPIWLPRLPGGDEALISYERAQRRFRADLGLAMPGEPDLAAIAAAPRWKRRQRGRAGIGQDLQKGIRA